MELSSMDVERKTFDGTRRGGVDRDQVGEYLARVARVLSKRESELSVSLRHAKELEHLLVQARREADEASRSFLVAADMKQRLLGEAETRALEILEAAHTDRGGEDPAGAARVDLDEVRRRSGLAMGEEGEDQASASSGSTGDGYAVLESARAEAADILASAREEARDVTTSADEQAAIVRAKAERVLEEARHALQSSDEESASSGREDADRIVAVAKAEAERLMAAATEKSDLASAEYEGRLAEAEVAAKKLVEEARVGSGATLTAAAEVEEEATRLGVEAERLMTAATEKSDLASAEYEGRLAEAEVAAKKLVEEARVGSGATLTAAAEVEEEATRLGVEAERLMTAATEKSDLASAEYEGRLAEAEVAAKKLVEEARVESGATLTAAAEVEEEATRLREEADAARAAVNEDHEAAKVATAHANQLVESADRRDRESDRALARAEARLEAAAAESKNTAETAAAEAATLRRTAQDDAKELKGVAASTVNRLLVAARRDAAELVSQAKKEAGTIMKTSRARHESANAKLHDLEVVLETIRRRVPEVATRAGAGAGDDADVVILLEEAQKSQEGISAEVLLAGDDDDGVADDDAHRSRYERRSAGLPRLGREASSDVLNDMSSLRISDADGKSRRRRSRS